jgi:hypothetical protein
MKFAFAPVAVIAFAAALSTAHAEDRPVTKGPTESMGDEGKLPATNTMGGQVRDMTGPQSATTPSAAEGSASGTSGKATNKRMGDEGTLPATGTMGNKVPDMTTQHDSAK